MSDFRIARVVCRQQAVTLVAVLAVGGLGVASFTSSRLGAASAQAPVAAAAAAPAGMQPRAVIDQYCVSCHNQRLKSAGLALDTLDMARINVGEGAEIWEKVHRKVRGGMMPPRGMPAPAPAVRSQLVTWLGSELDKAAVANPNPGRVEVFHRLNREEYRNAVRDLFALDIDAVDLLPEDNSGGGFDNMALVLKLSPSLMETYLTTARKIARSVVGHNATIPVETKYDVDKDIPQYDWIEGLPFGTRGGAVFSHQFPVDAEYDFKVSLAGGREFYLTEQLDVMIDGELVQSVVLPGKKARTERTPEAISAYDRVDGLAPDAVEAVKYFLDQRKPAADIASLMGVTVADVNAVAYVRKDERGSLFFRIPVKAGPREITAAFAQTVFPELEGPRKPFELPNRLVFGVVPQPFLASLTITGPYDAKGVETTPSRQKVFLCNPASAAQEAACARTILASVARRAYRRPASEEDVNILLGFYREGRANSGNFDTGIEAALRRVLVSPNFLYRIESIQAPTARGAATVASGRSSLVPVNDIDLASRLSFFLWSSIPDEPLLDLAARNRLHEPAVLTAQVKRMLADPRSSALTKSFAGQWLELRSVEGTEMYETVFPDFDQSLKLGLKRELELFFGSIVHEDRSVVDLVDGDYTFVNGRVARHYGIPGIAGSHFRRVTLPADSPRRGLIGKGAILLVTSNPARTSPVRRGKWILVNILGTPPSAPPPGVPPLRERREGNLKLISMRERMAQHRESPVCAGCHATIDPLGFALEKFDGVGKWRDVDDDFSQIDITGTMPDGTKFDNLEQFRGLLLRQPEQFVSTLTEKLLQYSLGRELAYYDMPAVRAIVRSASKDNNRFSSLIVGIVNSQPFRMRKLATAESTGLSASR